MRVLLDACVPRKIRNELIGHDVETARGAGLNELDDGPLLDAMANRFDVLVTVDKSIPFQQKIAGRPLSVVLLRARSNKLADLRPLVLHLLRALEVVKHGEVHTISTTIDDGLAAGIEPE